MKKSEEVTYNHLERVLKIYRDKLIDLSYGSPLINLKIDGRSSIFYIIDEIHEVLLNKLNKGESMEIIPLPKMGKDEVPRDEKTEDFKQHLREAQINDEEYLKACENLERKIINEEIEEESKVDREKEIENSLIKRLRVKLKMPKREFGNTSAKKYAEEKGINPSYELSLSSPPEENDLDPRHADKKIQTLLFHDSFEKKMNKLRSKNRSAIKERGVNILHIGFGVVRYFDESKDRSVSAPLLLLRLNLERERSKDGYKFFVEADGEIGVNYALLKKFKEDYGLDIENMVNLDEENKIEKYIKKMEDDHVNIFKEKEIKIERKIVIGLLPIGGLEMYEDINEEEYSQDDQVQQILNPEKSTDTIPHTDEDYFNSEDGVKKYQEERGKYVQRLDPSQRKVASLVAQGNNLVIQGPPGTGKSQVIVELIIQAMLEGKRILFMAEKQAALNVIKKRMDSLGFGNLILMMLPTKNRKEVFENIDKRIKQEPALRGNNCEFEKNLKKAYDSEKILNEYRRILDIKIQCMNKTVKDLIYELIEANNFNANTIDVPKGFQKNIKILEEEEESYFKDKLKKFVEYSKALQHLTENDNSWEKYYNTDTKEIITDEEVEKLQKAVDNLFEICNKLVKQEKIEDYLKIDSNNRNSINAKVIALLEELNENDLNDEIVLSVAENLPEIKNFENDLRSSRGEIEEIENSIVEIEGVLKTMKEIISIYPSIKRQKIEDIISFNGELESVPKNILTLPTLIIDIDEQNSFREFKTLFNGYKRKSGIIVKNGYSITELIQEKDVVYDTIDYLEQIASINNPFNVSDELNNISILLGKETLSFFQKIFPKRFISEFKIIDQFLQERNSLEENIYFDINDIDEGAKKIKLYDKQIGLIRKFKRCFQEVEIEDLMREIKKNVYEEIKIVEIPDKYLKKDVSTIEADRDMKLKNKESIINSFKDNKEMKTILSEDYKGFETEINHIICLHNFGEKINKLLDKEKSVVSLFLKNKSCFEDEIEYAKNWKPTKDLYKKTISEIEEYPISPISTLIKNKVSFSEMAEGMRDLVGQREALSEMAKVIEKGQYFNDGLHKIFEFINSNKGGEVLTETEVEMFFKFLIVYFKFGNKNFMKNFHDLDKDLAEIESQIDENSKLLKINKILEDLDNIGCPPGTGSTHKEKTEMKLIKHNINLQRSHIDIKSLMERAPESMETLFPCLAMSPTTIARNLPCEKMFDLLIIDEASQMKPESALGAIFRSRQIVVVGDSKQLPPSNFFVSQFAGDEEEGEDVSESLLGLADNSFSSESLLWHYRSKFPELIEFCNKHIYKNSLLLFPSTSVDHHPVSLIPVKAEENQTIYKHGVNMLEIKQMKKWLLDFAQDEENHDKSLGIVVMNKKQSGILEDEIDELCLSPLGEKFDEYRNSWSETPEPFIIKNLENIQGDERDIILIGLVYGPEIKGSRVNQRFGPINGSAGRYRLNVLFSRAREQTITFSSLKESDINADENVQDGKYLLREWIRYSKNHQIESGDGSVGSFDSDFEKSVAQEIERLGYDVVPQVGVSGYKIDLGIRSKKNHKKFCLGVECDGQQYHSSPYQIRYDKNRQNILEQNFKWDIYRIWSTDWFKNKNEEVKKLKEKIRTSDEQY